MTDPERNEVVWAPDPFKSSGNPRPWLIIATDRLPYPTQESIAVALTTQSHHPESIVVPGEAWIRGEPERPSYALPWSLATIKNESDIVGTQGCVTDEYRHRVVSSLCSYLDVSHEN